MGQLFGAADRDRARALVESQGLTFDPIFDDLVGVHEGGTLVGVGARHRDVLKMVAIEPSHQGRAVLGELVTELVQLACAAGHDAVFAFTKPEAVTSFERLNFALLASHGRAALLEYGGGLDRWLAAHRALVRPGRNGAVVVNCNPFTLGHRHLVEEAARAVDTLYVLVVREDCSAFPFEPRLRLVREGTADLPNVRVLDTGRYAVSAITFPSYFLRREDPIAEIQMELDLILFARRIAPELHVVRRFFGTEPTCPVTRAYNAAMLRILPRHGVEAIEIPRIAAGGAPISASRVRGALRAGDAAALAPLVPASTLRFLLSDEARPVRERLARGEERYGSVEERA